MEVLLLRTSIIKSLSDFQKLADVLKSRYQIKVLQIPVEETEGLKEDEKTQLLHFLALFLAELSKEEASQGKEFMTFLYAMTAHKNSNILLMKKRSRYIFKGTSVSEVGVDTMNQALKNYSTS